MRRIFTYSCLCPQCLYHDVIWDIAAAAARVNIINHGGDVVIVQPAAQCHLSGNMFKFTLILCNIYLLTSIKFILNGGSRLIERPLMNTACSSEIIVIGYYVEWQ